MYRKGSIAAFLLLLFSSGLVAAQVKPVIPKVFGNQSYTLSEIRATKENYKHQVDPKKVEILGIKLGMPFSKARNIVNSLPDYELAVGYRKGLYSDMDGTTRVKYMNKKTGGHIYMIAAPNCNSPSREIIVRQIIHHYGHLSYEARIEELTYYLNKYGEPTNAVEYCPQYTKSGERWGMWRLNWNLNKAEGDKQSSLANFQMTHQQAVLSSQRQICSRK